MTNCWFYPLGSGIFCDQALCFALRAEETISGGRSKIEGMDDILHGLFSDRGKPGVLFILCEIRGVGCGPTTRFAIGFAHD